MNLNNPKVFVLRLLKVSGIAFLSSILANVAYAGPWMNMNCLSQKLFSLDCGHWYVGANFGVSHLFDKKLPFTSDSVDENGPGWGVNVGYQANSFLGGELGYTKYHDSRETIGFLGGSVTVAKTEHYAAYLAGTLHYPLFCRFSAMGKLGVAYSYANKILTIGSSASSGSVSAYYGLGATYSVTPTVEFIGQWARVRGNNYTGSSDLYSLGATFAIV